MSTKKNKTDKFEEFRSRAMKIAEKSGQKSKSTVTDEPFILGEEYGFEPPIEIDKPVYTDRLALMQATQRQDIVSCLKIFFKADFPRFLSVMNTTGDDAELITLGISQAIFEHFYGIDVDQFDGGFPMLSI